MGLLKKNSFETVFRDEWLQEFHNFLHGSIQLWTNLQTVVVSNNLFFCVSNCLTRLINLLALHNVLVHLLKVDRLLAYAADLLSQFSCLLLQISFDDTFERVFYQIILDALYEVKVVDGRLFLLMKLLDNEEWVEELFNLLLQLHNQLVAL